VTAYATVEKVRALADDLSIRKLPADDGALERLIERASSDVELVLGQRGLDMDALADSQAAALAAATSWQAILLAVQGPTRELGADDLVTSVPLVSFASPSRAPRISPRAVESLAHSGLIQRSGTVKT